MSEFEVTYPMKYFCIDDVISKALGKESHSSGAGLGTRDMSFTVDDVGVAEAAMEKLVSTAAYIGIKGL